MTIRNLALALTTTAAFMVVAPTAEAGVDPYLGEMTIYPYTFCPRGWTDADGKLLPISSYSALFSLYGTTFGGDGRTTFGVPDMRSRSPMGMGNGPGLTPRTQGQKFGSETNVMTSGQMPSHTHQAGIQTKAGTQADTTTPQQNSFGDTAGNTYVTGAATNKFMHTDTVVVTPTGSSQAQNNLQPTSVFRYCVATTGTYPSRN